VQVDVSLKLVLNAPSFSVCDQPDIQTTVLKFCFQSQLAPYAMGLHGGRGVTSFFTTVRGQGLTFVHFSAQCKHFLWDTLAEFSSL